MADKLKVGLRARFFHPKTLGVMHWGRVVKIWDNGDVSVKFEIDGKTYRTFPDRNP